MVRAKFRCNSVLHLEHGEVVELSAVSDDANKTWAKWTPSGSVKIQIDNTEARGKFSPGKAYYVDFAPVD